MNVWQLFISQASSVRMVKCDFEKCSITFPFDKANPKKRFCCTNHRDQQVKLGKRLAWQAYAEAVE